jgi:hypothetical protein
MTKILKGKIVHQDGELMVQHSPKKIFGELRGSRVEKVFYSYDILDPFTEHNLKVNDEVDFVFEYYIANEGSFKFCEIVKK